MTLIAAMACFLDKIKVLFTLYLNGKAYEMDIANAPPKHKRMWFYISSDKIIGFLSFPPPSTVLTQSNIDICDLAPLFRQQHINPSYRHKERHKKKLLVRSSAFCMIGHEDHAQIHFG